MTNSNHPPIPTLAQLFEEEQAARKVRDEKPNFPNSSVWADAYTRLKDALYRDYSASVKATPDPPLLATLEAEKVAADETQDHTDIVYNQLRDATKMVPSEISVVDKFNALQPILRAMLNEHDQMIQQPHTTGDEDFLVSKIITRIIPHMATHKPVMVDVQKAARGLSAYDGYENPNIHDKRRACICADTWGLKYAD